ncbi:MAG: NAD(P)-binding domain-containing protein, partial [Candidatus Krumholzibacteriota bacterium]|nr:NAD(P)-binding domain-containing protein [Candidatus Krumholzibacteriota bacterium]
WRDYGSRRPGRGRLPSLRTARLGQRCWPVRLVHLATWSRRRAVGDPDDGAVLVDGACYGVPGEDLAKVYNRLHDPADFCGQRALIVGGGDSALETAIALAQCGGEVTLSYRKESFSRPKAENVEMLEQLMANPGARVAVENPSSERVTTAAGDFMEQRLQPGTIRLAMKTRVRRITEHGVELERDDGVTETIENEVVFSMIGREPPLDFFRRSGVHIHGEWNGRRVAAFAAFLIFCTALYNWKSGGYLSNLFYAQHWWPVSIADTLAATLANPRSLVAVVVTSASTPSFWYTVAYSLLITIFGVRRIRRRRTPYITLQTSVLMAIQVLPLFILPEILLPWLGKNAWLPQGFLDALFPVVDYGNGREYWRAYGLILAWPLNVYNVFTNQPLGAWLIIAFVQTFVLIPVIIYFWGKGAYCGWICSCGALAETLGDTHRTKMPHGPVWNRANVVGQVILAVAFVLLVIRIVAWTQPSGSALDRLFDRALHDWKWIVDVFIAGIIGYGFYFWYSGRMWCRFACPLAALMHIYARFSRFRIIADKKKCISCNVCTSVCHQGIDVMNFANKGLHMNDPQCVRCSACVQSCPTGVLTFGQVDRNGSVIRTDSLPASPVQMREGGS